MRYLPFDTACSNLRMMSPSLCGSDPYPCGSLTYRACFNCKNIIVAFSRHVKPQRRSSLQEKRWRLKIRRFHQRGEARLPGNSRLLGPPRRTGCIAGGGGITSFLKGGVARGGPILYNEAQTAHTQRIKIYRVQRCSQGKYYHFSRQENVASRLSAKNEQNRAGIEAFSDARKHFAREGWWQDPGGDVIQYRY